MASFIPMKDNQYLYLPVYTEKKKSIWFKDQLETHHDIPNKEDAKVLYLPLHLHPTNPNIQDYLWKDLPPAEEESIQPTEEDRFWDSLPPPLVKKLSPCFQFFVPDFDSPEDMELKEAPDVAKEDASNESITPALITEDSEHEEVEQSCIAVTTFFSPRKMTFAPPRRSLRLQLKSLDHLGSYQDSQRRRKSRRVQSKTS